MTEAAPGVLLATTDHATDRPTSPGVPHFFTDIRLGPHDELLVQGPNLSPGYWQHPAETSDAFHDGWFHTGDIAHPRHDGWIDIIDRVKDMYITLDQATILDHLATRIARYKLPTHIQFVTDLPRTASGKVRKAELRALLSTEDT